MWGEQEGRPSTSGAAVVGLATKRGVHMNVRKMIVALVGAGSLVVLAVPAAGAAGVTTQTRDIVGQGPGGSVVSADGAALMRSDTGLNARFSMPTPASGTYSYPGGNAFQPLGAVPGHPEAYSFWAFVFNYPSQCSAPCDINDVGNTPAQGGVYNVAGHVASGGTLQMSGHISVGAPTFAGVPLMQPRTAEVHLAVAPHGQLDPALMPVQITKPIGSPPYWWLAIFS